MLSDICHVSVISTSCYFDIYIVTVISASCYSDIFFMLQ